MLYVCVRDVMDVVFLLNCMAWSCMCSCMGIVSDPSYKSRLVCELLSDFDYKIKYNNHPDIFIMCTVCYAYDT